MTSTQNTKVVISGTKATVKITNTTAKILSNVHPTQPLKGTKNPPHVQVNLPKSIRKLFGA